PVSRQTRTPHQHSKAASFPQRRNVALTPTPKWRLSSMADDCARHALSQRASFEATHPAVMAAAGRLASEPVLRVADLSAADGVNSHGLIRDLVAQRAGRALIWCTTFYWLA
ncbi:MAG: hypothetical protein ACM4D3_22240, partial [Candidatus Sericytochromatia bacterium]